MKFTVLLAPDNLKPLGFTHIVAQTDKGRPLVAAFVREIDASQFCDQQNGVSKVPKAPEPKPVEIKVSDGLSLQQKIDAAQKSAAS
jgi:hypothetical protein